MRADEHIALLSEQRVDRFPNKQSGPYCFGVPCLAFAFLIRHFDKLIVRIPHAHVNLEFPHRCDLFHFPVVFIFIATFVQKRSKV